MEDEQINNQTMIASLLLNYRKTKKGKIDIVLDNSWYYHSQIVKDFLKEHPRIVLKFMPPYSSILNIIERILKNSKEKSAVQ